MNKFRPVHMATGEAFLANCDGELNLHLHPKLTLLPSLLGSTSGML
jgi:hypothetical protein